MKADELPDPVKIQRISQVKIDEVNLKQEFMPIEIGDVSSQDVLPFSVFFPFATGSGQSVEFIKIYKNCLFR